MSFLYILTIFFPFPANGNSRIFEMSAGDRVPPLASGRFSLAFRSSILGSSDVLLICYKGPSFSDTFTSGRLALLGSGLKL